MRHHHSTSDEEVAAEALARVEPRVRARESGLVCERGKLGEVVLVRVLRVHALARAEVDCEAERTDVDRLRARAFEVHLDSAPLRVVERDVAEGAQGEVRMKLSVDAREEIEVEGGGDAERVVVRGFENRGVFLEVCAEQKRVARAQHAAQTPEEGARAFAVEVADVRAEEEYERARVAAQVFGDARAR